MMGQLYPIINYVEKRTVADQGKAKGEANNQTGVILILNYMQ